MISMVSWPLFMATETDKREVGRRARKRLYDQDRVLHFAHHLDGFLRSQGTKINICSRVLIVNQRANISGRIIGSAVEIMHDLPAVWNSALSLE